MGVAPDLSIYPDQPGIYLYKDAKGKILYVGKARSIRKRLASYFTAGPKHPKTEALLAEFATIDTVVAKTESEALALENAFIKRHKPRYNIVLRDDKTYPYIKVTTGEAVAARVRDAPGPEGRPQLLRAVPPGADVPRRDEDGPADVPDPDLPDRDRRQAAAPLPLLRHARLPRPVRGGPDDEGGLRRGRRGRPPLPLREERRADAAARGEDAAAAEAENFEMAAAYRDCLRTVEELAEKQRVQSLAGEDVDVFGDFLDGGNLAVSLLVVRGGAVLDSREYFWEGIGDVDPEEFWVSLLSQYYDTTRRVPAAEILRECTSRPTFPRRRSSPSRAWLSERRGSRVTIRTPQRGAAFERVQIARDNARQNHLRRFRRVRERGRRRRSRSRGRSTSTGGPRGSSASTSPTSRAPRPTPPASSSSTASRRRTSTGCSGSTGRAPTTSRRSPRP